MKQLCVLFLSLTLSCFADESSRQLEFFTGYTNVTLYSFHMKFIAEQRYSDKLVQIVAIPQEQGIGFKFQNVQFEVLAPGGDHTGPVTKVHGIFFLQVGENSAMHLRQMIPVEIASVEEFSINPSVHQDAWVLTPEEALFQGNPIIRRPFKNMLSELSPTPLPY